GKVAPCSKWRSLRRLGTSAACAAVWTSLSLSALFCFLSFWFSALAFARPCTYSYASRNGCAIRTAAIWNGRNAVEPAPWTSWNAPAVGERNAIVTSANATMTSPTTTARRMSALRAFEGYGGGFERWTDEAMTAARALRLGGATAVGYRANPSSSLDRQRASSGGGRCGAGEDLVVSLDGVDDRLVHLVATDA